MQIGIFQSTRLEQRLFQSPQMIQAMQILQLSTLDLQDRIEKELQENPLLERKEASAEGSGGDSTLEAGPLTALDHVLAMRARDRFDPDLRRRRGSAEEADKKHEAMQQTPASYHSLGASILGLTGLMELGGRRRELLEFLVFSLDARGYLPCSLEELAQECGVEGAGPADFAALLEELRRATHPALGARDLGECLLLQLGDETEEHSLLRLLIADHLEDVASNRLPHIAKATHHTLEEVGRAVEELRRLDPCPGSAFGDARSETVRPEVVVEEVDGAFQVRLNREGSRELVLSPDYTRLLHEGPRDASAKKWLRDHLGSARWFIEAVEQRQATLLRIARAVFERQRPFLEKGPRALDPMRMGEIAEATGVHLSTVSRAVAGKYVQTPHGIQPLRFFFSSGTARSSGGAASQKSIQQRVKELVDGEDPSDPLSDDRLAELLNERDGIRLARRTITKYRKVLAIGSSSQRRVF